MSAETLPAEREVLIEMNGASHGSILIDGTDVAPITRNITVRMEPGHVPEVELEVIPLRLAIEMKTAHLLVHVDEERFA